MHLWRRIFYRLRRECTAWGERGANLFLSTYSQTRSSMPMGHRFDFLDHAFIAKVLDDYPAYASVVKREVEQVFAHRFDLLGSGPCVVRYGMACPGILGVMYGPPTPVEIDQRGNWLNGRINARNLSESQRIWRLIEGEYVPIDWQLDFKSGFRWSEMTWHRDIQFGDKGGVDVKVPWELGRMQHLPTLAMAAHFGAVKFLGFSASAIYAKEFRNQVLDFIATNPPGYGVNWACAMDVAIRIANVLVARDIFIAAGICFDPAFEEILASSARSHARHILANLEWSPRYRGNHYLANIVGLLFCAIYLPTDSETAAWLNFAAAQLLVEVEYQFHEDGSNFEASVCYHRLSAEIVVWGAALLSNLGSEKSAALKRAMPLSLRTRVLRLLPPLARVPERVDGVLPEWFWVRLARMGAFTKALSRPDGLVVQFGDNDSGRFLPLGSGEQLLVDNGCGDHRFSLDHRALIGAIAALTEADQGADPGSAFIRQLAGTPAWSASQSHGFTPIGDSHTWSQYLQSWHAAPIASRWKSSFEAPNAYLRDQLHLSAFPGMGCYIMRGSSLYLAVRCGEIGLAGLGAHAHCDQLSVELVVAGKDCIRDPGTWLYTPFPDQRNRYRSALAHHVPRVSNQEPAKLTLGVFDLRGAAEGECLYFGPQGFVGRHAGYGSWVYRVIAVSDNRVDIFDFAEEGLKLADPTPVELPFSPGYGLVSGA